MAFPIVFIHRGRSWYVDFALFQARRTNPQSPIILISDYPSVAKQFTRFVDFNEHCQRANDFALSYVHLSPLDPNNELVAIQRWFVLADWMRKNQVEKCVYLDSDILLYDNVQKDEARFSAADMTNLDVDGPLNGFINDLTRLEEFVGFIEKTYMEELEELIAWRTQYCATGQIGGITDMWLYHRFYSRSVGHPMDFGAWAPDGMYDYNLSVVQGCEMEGSNKKLAWRDNMPFGFHIATQTTIRFKSLHLQGLNKVLIPSYTRPRNASWLILWARVLTMRIIYWIPRFIKKKFFG